MIAFLLFLILCVLLFGAGAVLSGLGWLAVISIALLLVLLAVLGSVAFLRSIHHGIATERSEQRPWLYLVIGTPAVIGNFGVFALSWLQGGNVDAVPYWWVPVAIMFASMVVLALETANSWLRKVPGFIKGFFVGWAKFLVLPVLGPIGHWKSIRTPNLAGNQTGVLVASVSTLWTFIVAVFLWWFAVLPIVFFVAFACGAIR
ncbi:hypothetical protein [Bradyrhizobium sp. I1.7.5]|uniref:hypothetical protein n=1 Tax=Bradyrhizobium sp. I1.7.5 TaxID=3156363 RepID=UPI0033937BA7